MQDHSARPRGRQPRLTVVELAALCVTLVILTAFATVMVLGDRLKAAVEEPEPLAAYLAQTYGPDRFSENTEEWIIRDYFQDRRDGVFLDVGASHYRHYSNTYFLETALTVAGKYLRIDTRNLYFRPID